MSLHAEIVKILNDEGAASEGGWHSWRCFDKGRYPKPCECTAVVARMVMSAALDAARESVMLHATAGQGAAVPPREFVHTDSLLAAIDALLETA